MMKSLYIETTIPSYATAWDSRDVVKLNKQLITRAFWRDERHKFKLCTSEAVITECSRSDPDAAQRRVEFLKGIEKLPVINEDIKNLADFYQKLLKIPGNAAIDCTHLAICVKHNIDFLLSWNCAHLGPVAQKLTKEYNDKNGLWTPMLVTPENIVEYLQEAV